MDIKLIPLKPAHAEALFALTIRNRSHLRVWLPWADRIHNLADTQAFVDESLAQTAAGTQVHFLIEHVGRPVGTIGLIDVNAEQGTVGYWIDQSVQRKGLTTAALRALMRIAFEERGMLRLHLEYLEGNVPSARVAEKCGFVVDRVLPKQTELHGRMLDRTCCIVRREDEAALRSAPGSPTR